MKKIYTIFVCICLLAGFVACEKDKDFVLTTLMVQNETITPSYGSATIDCSFKADATISEAFVHYSLSSSFAKYDVAKMTEEKGKYAAQLMGLQDNTTYYIRYAVSNKYSSVVKEEVIEFQTLQCTVPTVVLDSIADVWDNRAKAYLHLAFDGGASVTDMGICWSKQANPTIEDIHKSTKDTVTVLDMTDLQENTKYYVRAYAVNKVGVSYSEEKTFTTTKDVVSPTVTTATVTQITETTAVAGGNVTSAGGAEITERGVVYATTQNPTTADNKVSNGTGTGSFTCNLTDLQPNAKYYVRAYAINEKGTAYGEEVTFTTNKQIVLPSVTTATVTQITETSAVAGGNVTSDGGASVTERGVVYSTNPNPVITNLSNTIRPCGSGTEVFTYTMTGLQPNTTYYVRAYATNEVGTAYGEEMSFTTETPAVHEYVDLGLCVKWATCNVGASKPEEYGDYFAWGETEPKEVYDWSTYKYCNDNSLIKLTKYNNNSNDGTVDNKTQLELTDDVARANWGGSWRMPTDAEMTELREQCTWIWTTQNGVNGYTVTSQSNGNSIFLPAAGFRVGSSLGYAGSHGNYWSSSLSTDYPYEAWHVYFNSGNVGRYDDSRYNGYSVRPICP